MRAQPYSQYGMTACRPTQSGNHKAKPIVPVSRIDLREYRTSELVENRTSSYSCSSRTSQKKGLKLAKQLRNLPILGQDKQNKGALNPCFSSLVTATFGRNSNNQIPQSMHSSLSNLVLNQTYLTVTQPSLSCSNPINKPVLTDFSKDKCVYYKNSIQAIQNSPQPSIKQLSRTQSLGSMTDKRSSVSTNISIESGKGLLNVPTLTAKSEYFRGSIIDDLKFPSMKQTA